MGLFSFVKAKSNADKVIRCPRCAVQMQKKSRQGVTIDKCRKCGGIWLDKGEIENIASKLSKHEGKGKASTVKKR